MDGTTLETNGVAAVTAVHPPILAEILAGVHRLMLNPWADHGVVSHKENSGTPIVLQSADVWTMEVNIWTIS